MLGQFKRCQSQCNQGSSFQAKQNEKNNEKFAILNPIYLRWFFSWLQLELNLIGTFQNI